MKILLFDNSALLEMDNDYCIEMRTGEFAKELQGLGNDVTFFGQILPETRNTTDVYKLKENGLKVTGLKRKKNKLFSYLSLYSTAIPSIYKSDFIYFFYPNAFKYLIPFCILFRKKYGLYIRGMDNLDDFDSRFFYKHAHVVFTVADTFTNYVNEISDKGSAHTIRPMLTYNLSDILSFRKNTFDNERLKILYLGRMSNDKGVIELLNAASILKAKEVDFFIKLVGNGEYINELQNLAINLKISDKVSFEGAVFDKEEIKKYYLEADIYILPTYHEGFPRTIYEAMLFELPIITTFVGGIPGLMKNRYNCLQITPKSPVSIVEAIEFAIEDYGKMREFAANGKLTIQKIFNERKKSHAVDLNAKLSW